MLNCLLDKNIMALGGAENINLPKYPKPADHENPAVRDSTYAKPFLRWIGGKQQIVAQLLRCLPEDVGSRQYIEPFVGAGSLFFALAPQLAVISDLNEHLIHCYKSICESAELLSDYLIKHRAESCCEYYYAQRELYNRRCKASKLTAAQAARFIYLNQANFNGVFRVNKKGEYNVPFGKKDHLALPSLEQLLKVADLLKTATILCAPYSDVLTEAGKSDFVYLDPPYPPLNGTAYFTHYTKDRFGENDQTELARLTYEASKRGCKIMMTNADTPAIRKLYEGFKMKPLPVTRFVTCKKERYKATELVITNYEVAEVRHDEEVTIDR